jgi:PAS domain S-box-containing protein
LSGLSILALVAAGILFAASVTLATVGLRRARARPETLREDEERYLELARFPSQNPNPVLRVLRDGSIAYANPASDPLLEQWGCLESRVLPDRLRRVVGEALDADSSRRLEERSGERICALTLAPVEGADYVNMYGLDVTDRKHAERKVEENLQILDALLSSLPTPVFFKDSAGRYLGCNRAFEEFFAVGIDDIRGKTVREVWDEPGAGHYRERELDLLRTGGSEVYETEFRDAGGRPHRIILGRATFNDADGKVAGLVAALHDVTEIREAEDRRRQLESQIQHSQKLESLGVLAGGIAHDFNNLLTGILGNANLALMEMTPEAATRQTIEQIEVAAKRAADLTKQLLAYSGKGRFVVQRLDLSAVVEEMAHLLAASISKKATLHYCFTPDLPQVEADGTQLRQVVMNLITNASDALGNDSGVIGVATGVVDVDRDYLDHTFLDDDLSTGPYVFIEVSDNGCGMDPDTVGKIFDPFFTTKFTGRGLGLAAVLGIVRGHHGAIDIQSEPGRGTTVKVLLPAVEKTVSRPVQEDRPAEEWKGGGTILVVDDEETVRGLARLGLETFGFDVVTAADGVEAVEKFREHGPSIVAVLLDMTMPRMDGRETFRELRRIRPDVRVVLSSGYNEQEATSPFTGEGLAGFIQKPYLPRDLAKKIREAIES